MLFDEALFKIKMEELNMTLDASILALRNEYASKKMLRTGNYLQAVCESLLSYIDMINQQVKNNCLDKLILEKSSNIPVYEEIEHQLNQKIRPEIDKFQDILKREILVTALYDNTNEMIEALSFHNKVRNKLNIFYKELEFDLKKQVHNIYDEREKRKISQDANRIAKLALLVSIISVIFSIGLWALSH